MIALVCILRVRTRRCSVGLNAYGHAQAPPCHTHAFDKRRSVYALTSRTTTATLQIKSPFLYYYYYTLYSRVITVCILSLRSPNASVHTYTSKYVHMHPAIAHAHVYTTMYARSKISLRRRPSFPRGFFLPCPSGRGPFFFFCGQHYTCTHVYVQKKKTTQQPNVQRCFSRLIDNYHSQFYRLW